MTHTYTQQIKLLLSRCGCSSTIYRRRPTKAGSVQVAPLTDEQRQQVEDVSRERGYRRFTAEMVSAG